MIRQGIRPIVIASMACGIAQKAMEEPDMLPEDRLLFEQFRREAESLILRWPVRLRSDKEASDIGKHLDRFLQQTHWDEKPRHIQTYVHFICYLLEGVRECVRNEDRRKMIDDILDAAMKLWERYSSGRDREYEWCLAAGVRAARQWEEIMTG